MSSLPAFDPATCRSCGAAVIFVTSGKSPAKLILDAKPEKRVIVARVRHLHLLAATDGSKHLDDPVGAVIDVYTDHHATCSDAAAWHGRTRAGANDQ
jgi:hypothetical protein